MSDSLKAAVVVTQGSAGLFLFITYLHHFTPWLPNKHCSRSSVEISALFSYSYTEEEEKKKFYMEPGILLFPDLLFVHCVTFRQITVVCVSYVQLCFLVAVQQCLVILFDRWMYGSRKQVFTCSAQIHQETKTTLYGLLVSVQINVMYIF